MLLIKLIPDCGGSKPKLSDVLIDKLLANGFETGEAEPDVFALTCDIRQLAKKGWMVLRSFLVLLVSDCKNTGHLLQLFNNRIS